MKTVITAALLAALLATGCASTPRQTAAASTTPQADCQRLLSEMAESEQDKKDAAAKKDTAWKAVVPFLVTARYVDGKNDLGEADERIGKLQNEFDQRGCNPQRS